VVNLLFIALHPDFLRDTNPFVVAYNLDTPNGIKEQWRVDSAGVKYGVTHGGMKGVWGYLYEDKWQQLTYLEAYARFPALKEAIESHKEEMVPW
jgi:hypothetical protein